MKIKKIRIYVLNYNGEQLLQECLPSIERASQKSREQAKVFVIDNESTDTSLNVLKTDFPNIPVLHSKNRFLCSFNDFVMQNNSDLVILMNNDIKVKEDFIDPIIRMFEKYDDAFIASSMCWDFSGKIYEGSLSALKKKYGWWGTLTADPVRFNQFEYTASVGACMSFRRDRFVELGGFDDLFLPGTLEDLDICYRGWKRGWKAYFVRDSIIYHKGQATFKQKFGSAKIRELAMRNTFLFIWKNIYDSLLLFEHFFWIGPRLIGALLIGDFPFIIGCFKAFGKIGSAWQRREKNKPEFILSDKDVLKIFEPLTL